VERDRLNPTQTGHQVDEIDGREAVVGEQRSVKALSQGSAQPKLASKPDLQWPAGSRPQASGLDHGRRGRRMELLHPRHCPVKTTVAIGEAKAELTE